MNPIYRIQGIDGRGPYRPGSTKHWCDVDARRFYKAPLFATYMDEFPAVVAQMDDLFLANGGHFGCGFRTLKQLHRWFTDNEIRKLRSYGYWAVIIIPDEVLAESDNQLVFWCKRPLKDSTQSLALADV